MNAYQLMRITQDPIDPDKRLKIHKLFAKKARRRVIPQHIYRKHYHPPRDRFYRVSGRLGTKVSHPSNNRRFSSSPSRSKINTILQDVDIPMTPTYKKIKCNKTKSHLIISPNHEYVTGNLFDPPVRGKRRIAKSNSDLTKFTF